MSDTENLVNVNDEDDNQLLDDKDEEKEEISLLNSELKASRDKNFNNENALKEYQKTHDLSIRDSIICNNLPLAMKIAKQYADKFGAKYYDDFINEGSLGLMDAIDAYDFSRNTKFSTLATTYIKNSILNSLKTLSPIKRDSNFTSKDRNLKNAEELLTQELKRTPTDEELASKLGCTIDDVQSVKMQRQIPLSLDFLYTSDDDDNESSLASTISDTAPTPQELAEKNERLEKYYEALDILNPREKDIWQLYAVEKKSLQEIANKYGVSFQRIFEIIKQIKKKMKNYISTH